MSDRTFTDWAGSRSSCKLALQAADGSIVVGGGQYPSGNSCPEMLIGHLTASGVADTSFGPDGTGFTTVQDG